ncbi:B12-binding domain-containing radical SAM protein [Sedimentibacter sp.]|uniref:B12-binding domain-containing radical SAM protein n=1 Tax=Sedimentibacter sp. TaxID=1960295 RepID=UPI0028B1811F|nr:B12-binding domain-containing radical SAM protein [Sedimentibacter sp.]
MLKVLLIRPRPHNETIGLQHVMICEPLELEYLISNVNEEIKNQVQIKIYDLIVEKKSYEDILSEDKPDFVLFTGYITHVGIIKKMAGTAKKMLPFIYTGVGGVHAEVVPEDYNSEYIDFVYSKNGIDGFNKTLSMILKGNDVKQIKNEINQAAKNDSFNHKHPDRSSVSKYRKHYYYMFHSPCALIKTSFGCPYNCSFCFCKEITDGKYFSRDMDDVLNELQAITEEEIYIVDDDFLFNVNKLRKFIEGVRNRNLKKKFLVYGRADFIAENKELITELKDVGLQAVIVGIESVRSKDLEAYNKRTTKDINERCIKILRDLDIELYATLIIPLDFTVSDFNELTTWLKSMDVRFVNLQPLTPLPGTDIFDSYTSDLLVKRESYEVWDMAHVVLKPEFMSIRKFYAQLLKAYYKVIMRPKHLLFLIKKYGFRANLKMLAGSSFVSMQYIKKIVRGH